MTEIVDAKTGEIRPVQNAMKHTPEMTFLVLQLDERFTIQKGVFLYPCDASQSFEINLRAMPGWNDPSKVLRLDIPLDERRPALKALHSMNISRATLFPGLDGFAQSLKVYHSLL
jgi:hypothetical protein